MRKGFTGHEVKTAVTDSMVIYRGTVVFSIEKDGNICLNHGGWMTRTTKRRMNQAAEHFGYAFNVVQKDFDWYVERPGKEPVPFDGEYVVFSCGRKW